jgi:hypothetical protein
MNAVRAKVLLHMAMMRDKKAMMVRQGDVSVVGGRPVKARCERDYKAVPRKYCRCNACRLGRESRKGMRGIGKTWERREPVQTKARRKQVGRDGGHLVCPIGKEMRNMLEQWVERVKGMGLTSMRTRISCGKFGHASVGIDLE